MLTKKLLGFIFQLDDDNPYLPFDFVSDRKKWYRKLPLLLYPIDDEYCPTIFGGLPPINDGEFHHIAITREGSVISVYLDGVLFASGNLIDDQLQMDSDNRIGHSHFDNNELNGELKRLRFYNYSLNAGEIEDLYELEG